VAPEIDTDFVHDFRVDLWSLGTLLYVLLCGVGPFTGTGKKILKKKNNGVVEFEMVQPSVSAQRLIKSLLRVDPTRRLSVEQILRHNWMNESDEDLGSRDLELALIIFGDWGHKTQRVVMGQAT
jgi:serine/threonine protein kinase